MTRWIDLYIQKAEYISQVFDAVSTFETYMHDFIYNYDTNDGTVEVYVRMSYDGSTWEDWIRINDVALPALFRNDFYYMEYCKFQYKVVMVNNGLVSPVFKSFSFALTGSFILENKGDVPCKPELWIKKTGSGGTIKLTNESNGQVLELKNLNLNETVYIDCENEDIATDLPLRYRYNDHNNVFLELEVGENLLTGEGEFELTIRHEFKLLQG